jgi:hypothetical protein
MELFVVVVEERLAGGLLRRDFLDPDGDVLRDDAIRADLVAPEGVAGDLATGEVGLLDGCARDVVGKRGAVAALNGDKNQGMTFYDAATAGVVPLPCPLLNGER